jgi:DNA helicase-2/ATP-dependent DNA helicase PcrA
MLNLSSLNPQQRQAVETIKGPVLILAGAGTGKTRVITHRIVHLAEQGVNPSNVLAVTFTNKAAREMKERVRSLSPRRPKNADGEPATPTVSTFHSLCVRILRQHIEKLGYKRNFVIYDESEQLGTIKKILSHLSARGEKTDPSAILSLLSRFKNGGQRAAVFDDPSVRAMAEHVQSRYDLALRACNAVDFDDLILLTLRLFNEHPEALEACRQHFRYVMVDEYQDTNASQFQLVHQLTREHRNLCVVGDDDQSIYGWRGAEISNLLDMEKHYPEVKIVKLEQNYRSTNTILRAANSLIRHNIQRRGKQLWSQKGDGARIILQTYDNDELEAMGVVEQIESARMLRRIPWSQQAILFRTNIQSRPIETALRQASVRYHLIGGQSFFDRREVRDFLAFLKTLLNPNDDVSLLRIANVPARGLTDLTMERLLHASQERKCSVFAAMANPVVTTTFQSRTRESIEQFVSLIQRYHDQLKPQQSSPSPFSSSSSNIPEKQPPAKISLRAWADQFINEIGYLQELKRSEKNADTAQNRIRNIQELIATLADTGTSSNLTGDISEALQEFLEKLTLDSDREEEKETEGDAVTLITMHSCKGLEFPHVYIVGLEEGLLPHSRSKAEKSLDEERRLFYVAITRAMETLRISHCSTRKKYGTPTPCHPSSFLNELPSELIEHGDQAAKMPVAVESGKSMFAAMRDLVG